MSAVGVSSSETFLTGVEMYCKGRIQNTFTTNFNFSRAFHLLTLDKFFICLFFLMVDIFNISGAVLIAKQCKYFVVVKFGLHLFALANFFSFNSLFLLLTGIVIINIDVLKNAVHYDESSFYLLDLANFCFSNSLLVAAFLNISRETLQRIN